MTPPPQPIPLNDPAVRTPESIPDANALSDFDEYINAELMLEKEGEGMVATGVVRRSLGPDGNTITKCWTQGSMIIFLWTGRFNN